jgi:hypothetical protein
MAREWPVRTHHRTVQLRSCEAWLRAHPRARSIRHAVNSTEVDMDIMQVGAKHPFTSALGPR